MSWIVKVKERSDSPPGQKDRVSGKVFMCADRQEDEADTAVIRADPLFVRSWDG